MTQITALAISIVIETAVIMTLLRKHIGDRFRLLAIAVTPTLLSHPFLWTTTKYLAHSAHLFALIFALEILVVLAEGALLLWLCKQSFAHCLFISLAANAISASFGALCWYFS